MEKTRRTARLAFPVVILLGLSVALVGGPTASAGPGLRVDPEDAAALGTAFTYQGTLTDGADPANGLYDLTFSLHDSLDEGSQVGPTISRSIRIDDGLFSVELDFGAVFDGTALWLEVGVRESGSGDAYSTLHPRQPLTAAPFASYAINTSWSGIAGVPEGLGDGVDDDALGSLDCSAGEIARWNGSTWECAIDLVGEGPGWSLTGNAGTIAGTHFLGTTDDQPLELHVNGSRALRLEPNGTSPNVLGGYSGNGVGAGVVGATVAGGGRDLATNQVSANFGTVAGGSGNSGGGYAASVGGGEGNQADGSYATAGGGQGNTAVSTASTVGGGASNTAGANYATVGGGRDNQASGLFAVVGGGADNDASADYATAGGGFHNAVEARYGTIGGGGPADPANPTTSNNRVYDEYGTVGGGGDNAAGDDDADPTSQPYATVAGGAGNEATASYATAGGGTGNTAEGYAAFVGGGAGNVAGDNYATAAGGSSNVVEGPYATVAGGQSNVAENTYAAVGGGSGNRVTAAGGTVPGGLQNVVSGNYSVAAGYTARAEHAGSFVWSGSSEPFTTTAPNQFLVDASGGVGIGTNTPSEMLTVNGSTVVLGSGELTARGVYTSSSRLLDAPSAIDAAGSLVYVTSYSTNTLTILDVSDPDSPLPLGWTTSNLSGPADVQVVGQRAYVASQLNDRLVVIDVSDPHSPDSLGSSDQNLGNPVGVYVSGKYAYVASSGAGDGSHDGLTIFDISDPANIIAKDFASTNLSGTSDVAVSGKYAYVTSKDNDRFVVFDVSDPRAIELRGFTSGFVDGPTAVQVRGGYAYVVAETGNDLVIFDVSDPNNVAFVGAAATDLTYPRSVFVSGDYAYVAFAGDPATADNCGLAVFDVSDPANIAVRSVIDMSGSQPRPKPVFVHSDGPRLYVANEGQNSLAIYDANHTLDAPVVETGDLQTTYLDVARSAAIHDDLAVHGGLQVGPGGARIEGALSATGPDDNYIFGALGVGGAGAVISDTVLLTRTLWITAPTHALDVIGEGRFRVNDYHNLVLRSPNAGSDEDAIIDFIRSDQTDVITPSARIEFDAADPFTHTTSIHFYTQAPDDATMVDRLAITEEGDVLPGVSGGSLLGNETRRWDTVYTVNGVDTPSDGRDKEQVYTLSYGLDEVSALRPVIYTWRADPDQEPHYGFIAQEVRDVLPEIVAGDEAEGSLSMSTMELVPVLVKAVQEQQEELEAQDERIAALEARLAALEGAPGGRASRPDWLSSFSLLSFGGLVLGALVLAGRRRLGGLP
jgi:hypothetical protein